MENIDYSVIIRTTGKAHLKYQKLLDSISRLEPQPQEVLVVLPEGNELPEEQLGWESFLFCPKGMVRQRMEGINACKTPYALICDDDITFPADFVKKLYFPLKMGVAAFSVAPLYSFLPDQGINMLADILMAKAVPMFFHRADRFVSVLKSTGYLYNRHLDRLHAKYYETQSAPWTCFFADIEALKSTHFEKEIWLDLHGYSALDDQTMFYKAWLMGKRTVAVSNAYYTHLDAGTSKLNNKSATLYSGAFNRVVFWHRFIFSTQNSCWGRVTAKVSFLYYIVWHLLWSRTNILRGRISIGDYKLIQQGFIDGKAYLKSEEYLSLKSIKQEMVENVN